jgi:hypothetical protein
MTGGSCLRVPSPALESRVGLPPYSQPGTRQEPESGSRTVSGQEDLGHKEGHMEPMLHSALCSHTDSMPGAHHTAGDQAVTPPAVPSPGTHRQGSPPGGNQSGGDRVAAQKDGVGGSRPA